MSGSNDLQGDLVAEAQRGTRGETGALVLLERETEMRNLSKKAKTIIAGAAVAGLISAGGAYAYWTTTGNGSGTAAVATSNGSLVLTSGALSGAVTPGSTRTFTIYGANAGTTDLRVNSISTVVSSTTAGCQTLIADFSVAPVDSSGVNVAHGASGVALGTASLVYVNDPSVNQDACQTAPLTFTFSAS